MRGAAHNDAVRCGEMDYHPALVKGTIVGSYRIVDTLSVGGMGTVYRAEHTLLGRAAAVKILHPELCANRDIVNRFFNEARTTSSIQHPGIVEVFDFGYMASGHAYLVMEFLDGMPLSHRVRRRGAIAEAEAALLLRSVCIALSAAHDKGVVHRDLKPDNIFVMPDPDSVFGERTKILDFGIAKLTDIGLAGTATKTGAVMGTPTYMSPEQCRGTGEVDARADLYSIGCMLYELVTGQPPFVRSGAGELIGCHLFVEPEPPSRLVALSAETEALIMCLLSKQPERRVQTAKELAHRLALIAQQHGWMALGEISRPSLGPLAVASPTRPDGAATSTELTTPMFTPPGAPPASELPTTLTPSGPLHRAVDSPPTPPPAGAAAAAAVPGPTTLSGAASELGRMRRSRRGLRIAVAAGLIAGAGIAAVVVFGTGSRGPRPAAAASSTPAPSAPHAQVIELPIQPSNAAPPAIAPPSAAPPSTASPSTAPPPAAPADPAPATAVKPPASPAKPAVKPVRKPRRPDAGSAKEPKDLLEHDI